MIAKLAARVTLPGALCLVLVGCASALNRQAGRPQVGPTDDASPRYHVMTVLRPAPPSSWGLQATNLAARRNYEIVAAWNVRSLRRPCIVYSVPGHLPLAEVLEELAAEPGVDLAQPVYRFRTMLSRYNDPHYELQHGPHSLHLSQAHRMATGKGVRIGVVDTGIDVGHPDLKGRVVRAMTVLSGRRRSFTGDVHGTAVAGVIAARANNDVGIVGVAPDSRVVALKACWAVDGRPWSAECDSYTLLQAIDVAIEERVQVLNLSLSGPPDPALTLILDHALRKGITVVAAFDPEQGDSGGFPASLPGAISVMEAPIEGHEGVHAHRPAGATLAAPGLDILTTIPRGAYDFHSGSSLAAAHVSGMVALLLELDPEMTPPEILERLRATSRSYNAEATGETLWMADACAALASDPAACLTDGRDPT